MKPRNLCASCTTVVGLLRIFTTWVQLDWYDLVDCALEVSVAYTRATITPRAITVSALEPFGGE